MKKSRFSKDLFIFSVLTVITALTWIGLDAYRSLAKKEIPKILQEQIEPLVPQLETKILDTISQRTPIIPGELLDNLPSTP